MSPDTAVAKLLADDRLCFDWRGYPEANAGPDNLSGPQNPAGPGNGPDETRLIVQNGTTLVSAFLPA